MKYLSLTLICLSIIACSKKPEPINYGTDACEHCKMTIMDQKYGAEIITGKGKILKFDSAECMVDFIKSFGSAFKDPGNIYLTTNTAHPAELIEANKAAFLHDRAFKSPMGGNLACFTSKQLAENNRQSADASILNWDELLKSR